MSYHQAILCHGIHFKRTNSVSKTRNPLWGKYKFDPETGNRVNEFIETIDDNEVLRYCGDGVHRLHTVELPSGDVFYGLLFRCWNDEYMELGSVDGRDSMQLCMPVIKLLDMNRIPFTGGRFIVCVEVDENSKFKNSTSGVG